MDAKRKAAIEARAKQIPAIYRRGYLLETARKASTRGAIKSMCLECMGWQRLEITACTDFACPLFAYRPFSNVSTPRKSRGFDAQDRRLGHRTAHDTSEPLPAA